MAPMRAAADMTKLFFQNPINPWTHTSLGRSIAAGCEVLERTTRRYGKPEFDLPETEIDGKLVAVHENIVWGRPFCDLIHFDREVKVHREDPKILIVAPMSGHYATLLRGTVETLMPHAEVYITDWIDARMVPIQEGKFDLDDYIDYIIAMLQFLGPDTHVLGVCQPSVPVLAAVAAMEGNDDPFAPSTMTLMGGPIDTRVAPTAVNDLAVSKGMDWFENNVIMKVPFPQPGFMRDVYPGFLQLSGFMGMNLDRHVSAHREFFQHLIEGDGDSAEKHRDFYDEYLAVMDLTAEFYLQTVETVFIEHSLPNGTMMHNGSKVDCSKITRTALMTVEGEKDDITGRGQTKAAHDLCSNLPEGKKAHYEQPNVGHYGVFNGSRWRSQIAPRVMEFIHANRPGPIKDKTSSVSPKSVSNPVKAKKKSRKAIGSLEEILLAKPKGVADDLTAINGVGPKLQTALNEAGIFHFWQIAGLTGEQIEALDNKLDFRGRMARDNWIKQAQLLSETVS